MSEKPTTGAKPNLSDNFNEVQNIFVFLEYLALVASLRCCVALASWATFQSSVRAWPRVCFKEVHRSMHSPAQPSHTRTGFPIAIVQCTTVASAFVLPSSSRCHVNNKAITDDLNDLCFGSQKRDSVFIDLLVLCGCVDCFLKIEKSTTGKRDSTRLDSSSLQRFRPVLHLLLGWPSFVISALRAIVNRRQADLYHSGISFTCNLLLLGLLLHLLPRLLQCSSFVASRAHLKHARRRLGERGERDESHKRNLAGGTVFVISSFRFVSFCCSLSFSFSSSLVGFSYFRFFFSFLPHL